MKERAYKMAEEQCKFCEGKLKDLFIKKFRHWTVYLHDNQYYLGRTFTVLNRHGPESTLSLSKEEWEELKVVLDKVTKSIQDNFKPDLFSYLVLQNKDRHHFHFHVIPRYEKERKVDGEIFKDENWGKSPIPSPDRKTNKEIIEKIKNFILNKL
jgi:diadenosine tetraphosphate (Ap4A) HIT family hydrolase